MADLFAAQDATGTTVEILTDEVTDGTLGTAQKQLVGVVDATIGSTNKLTVDASGRAKVDASGVPVPVTDNGGSLTVDGAVSIGAAIPAGTNIIGKVDVNNFPASADTTDSVSAALQVNRVMFNLTEVTPQQAFGNVGASATDSSLIAAVSSKKIYVLALAFVAGATATNATFNSKGAGAGTAISPLFANAANGGAVLPFNPAGWFVTNTSEALTVTTGAGSTTGILVVYAAA